MTNDPLITLGQVYLFIRLGDSHNKATIIEVEALSVNSLVGTRFVAKDDRICALPRESLRL